MSVMIEAGRAEPVNWCVPAREKDVNAAKDSHTGLGSDRRGLPANATGSEVPCMLPPLGGPVQQAEDGRGGGYVKRPRILSPGPAT